MIDTDYIYFIAYYPSDESTIFYDSVRVLVDELYHDGFTLTTGYAFPFSRPENIVNDENKLIELVSNCIPKDKGSSETLHFWQYPFEFSLSFQMEDEYGIEMHISVAIETLLGTKRKLGKENSLEFIKVVQSCTVNFPPVFGCGFTSEEPPLPEEAIEIKVNRLYPINYYGIEYVNLIGKDKIFSTPAWLVEEVGEGVLLIPSLRELYDLNGEKMQEVAECLGLSLLDDEHE